MCSKSPCAHYRELLHHVVEALKRGQLLVDIIDIINVVDVVGVIDRFNSIIDIVDVVDMIDGTLMLRAIPDLSRILADSFGRLRVILSVHRTEEIHRARRISDHAPEN